MNWSRWLRSDALPDGAPTRACGGLTCYTTLYGDIEATHDQLDVWMAEATNAAVDSLVAPQQKAIYVEYGLASDNNRPEPYETLLEQATIAVGRSLARRGVWLGE